MFDNFQGPSNHINYKGNPMMAHNRTLVPINPNYQQNNTPPEFLLSPYPHGRFISAPQACVCCQQGQYMHQTPKKITNYPQQPAFINENRKVHVSRYMVHANSSLNLKGIKFIQNIKRF